LRILFDTSVAIAFRDGDRRILARAREIEPVALISAVTWVELESGVPAASEGKAARRAALDAMGDVLDILAFGPVEAVIYGRIVDAVGFSQRKIIDRMIAAQAISADARLATLNPKDFRGIPGLAIEDWTR
jgi:tRNA(fMet)-specific endonuclease VapC